jgi:hypothetical protein
MAVQNNVQNSSIWHMLKTWIFGILANTQAGKAWQVTSIHSALKRGSVTVHNIRPIGAASYIIQIDDGLDVDKVESAWRPSMMRRLISGTKAGNAPITDVRQREFVDALRMEAAVRGADNVRMLESGVMPPTNMVRGNARRADRSIEHQNVQLTPATLLSTLLRAAGLEVAECTELADGGYGTRYFALSVVA